MELLSIAIELFACIISFYINIFVISSRYECKREIKSFEYIIWGGLFTLITYWELFSNLAASLIGMGICLFFAIQYYKGSWIGKLLSILIVNAFSILISAAALLCGSVLLKVSIQSLTLYHSSERLLLLFIVKMMCIFFAQLGIRLSKGKNYLHHKDFYIILVIYSCFFCVAFFSLSFIVKIALPKTFQLLLIALNLMLFIVNLLILYLLKQMNFQHQYQMENSILRTQLKEQEQRIQEVENSNQQIRSLRHDMKNYLFGYSQLLKEGKTQTVLADIEKKLQLKLYSDLCVYTDNSLINSLLNVKAMLCEEHHIDCRFQIQNIGNTDSLEFAVLMSNIIDNAIEAELKETEASRQIWVFLFAENNNFHLVVRNYIHTSVLENNPSLLTTKSSPFEHGLGLYGVSRLVKENNGLFTIVEEDDFFVVQICYPFHVEKD